jgi:hypothetical protein
MEKQKQANKQPLSARLGAFFASRPGRILLIIAALLLAYVFASWAIDSGSILDWAIMFVLLIIAVRETAALIKQAIAK